MIDTHNLSVREAVHQVSRVTDRDKLARIRDREEAHPRKAGGRKQVITAIDAQLARSQPMPADGPWRENKWSGLPHFECTRCSFDTLERGAIREHVKTHDPAVAHHPPEAAEVVGFAHADALLAATAAVETPSAPAEVADTTTATETEN